MLALAQLCQQLEVPTCLRRNLEGGWGVQEQALGCLAEGGWRSIPEAKRKPSTAWK